MNNAIKQVALVTGGSRGIGFGCADHLAAAGFELAINGVRHSESIAAELDRLRRHGGDVIYCRGNIATQTDRNSILTRIKKHYGRLNVLINNAGVGPQKRVDVLETTEESYDHVMGINLKGAFFLSQAAADWMIDQKKANSEFKGCIINMSSISASVASVSRGEYCIAKAGLSMVTKLFAVRLGEFDIPVFEIQPGIIRTDMTAGVAEKYDQLIADGLCITGRWGFPDDVGKAAAALASGEFPYSTGQVIMVDGGLTLPRL